MPHRLRAVWFADIAGFTALSARDENEALSAVQAFQIGLGSAVRSFDGRIVKTMGDGALAEFESTEAAVRAACQLTRTFTESIQKSGGSSQLRIGVHAGDVAMLPDGDLYGDGVNFASRIQTSADPGQVLVSDDVYRQLRPRADFVFESVGDHRLKGLVESAALYAVRVESEAANRVEAAWPEMATERSLAVLPFDNLSAEPENEYFADGMTEDVLTAVSKIRGLRVISRTSVMKYKSKEVGLLEISSSLGVDLVLEGSVRRQDGRIRVTAQLIEARGDTHLWASTFDRDLDDVFAIQSEIADRIATALRSRLTPRERDRIQVGRTTDVTAWDLYLRGRSYLNRIESGNESDAIVSLSRTAILHFEKALEIDPMYVLAHAGVARARISIAGCIDEPSEITAATASARTAITLGPEVAESHFALASLYFEQYMESSACDELRRAVELDPNHAEAVDLLAWSLFYLGQWEEAVRCAHRAALLEPTEGSHAAHLGRLYVELGDFENGERWYRKALEVEPDCAWAHGFLARLHLLRGEVEEAERVLVRAAEILPRAFPIWIASYEIALVHEDYAGAEASICKWAEAIGDTYKPWSRMAFVAQKLDRQEEAEEFLERAEKNAMEHLRLGCEGWDPHRLQLVQVLALRGEEDRALDVLEESIDRGWFPHRHNRIDPLLFGLRGEERYVELMERVDERLARSRDRVGSIEP